MEKSVAIMEIMEVHDHDYDTGYLHLSKTWYMIHEIKIKELLTITVLDIYSTNQRDCSTYLLHKHKICTVVCM